LKWLGFAGQEKNVTASDYFQQLYEWAMAMKITAPMINLVKNADIRRFSYSTQCLVDRFVIVP
jgi:hypothetical protein